MAENNLAQLDFSSKINNFKQIFKLTWLFVSLGLVLFLLFHLAAIAMPKKSFFFYFLENFGIFMMLSTLLMAYSGVYSITTSPANMEKITRTALKDTFKRTHYIFGISFLTILIFVLILFIQVGFSAISNIPYVGPAVIAILTVPIFLINFILILLGITIFSIAPPVISEASDFKSIFLEVKISVKERWLNVVIYVIVSTSILFLAIIIFYYLVQYTTGVTNAIQWKINAAYPKVVKAFAMKSFFSDLVTRITPRPDSIAAYRKYGRDIFKYLEVLRYVISFSYIFIFSFIISLPLSVYFNRSSVFFGRVNSNK